MKKTTFSIAFALVMMLSVSNVSAQKVYFSDSYGGALNLGVGIGGYSGYYGYIGHTLPVLSANYEFDVARNFTLAPFATFYSYSEPYYRQTVIPLGVKGSLYLDQLLRAGSNWDFYVAGSLGFAIVNTTWDAYYLGDRTYLHETSPLFMDFHIGTEYRLSRNIGLFLDLSTGVSTVGIAIH